MKRTAIPVIDEATIAREQALRAYRAGFAIGADSNASARRHVVEPSTHEHWRRGYEAGRAAAEAALAAYRDGL